MIPFPEYAPDQPDYFAGGAPVIKNVIPTASGYRPFPSFSVLSQALPSAPKGLYFNIENDGTVTIFAGTITKLFKLNLADYSWDDVTNTGGDYTGNSSDGWVFAQFGALVIATNGVDNNQVFTVGTSTNFEDLGGSPPIAKRCVTVGDYLILYGLLDNPERVHWSATNDATGWTIGEANSGAQDFPEGGEVQFVSGIDRNAIILQKSKSRFMLYTPSNFPFLWRFNEIESRGAISHRSCTTNGSAVFFQAQDGFYTLSPNGPSVPIGAERVDQQFRKETSSLTNFEQVLSASDPANKLIIWAYSTTGEGVADAALGYAWEQNKWVDLGLGNLTFIGEGATANQTLEQIGAQYATLEDVPGSFDSARWQGGKPILAAFNESFELGFFDGPTLEATLQTADLSFQEGRRARIRAFRPITDGTNVFGRVGSKQTWQGAITYSSEKQADTSTGRITTDNSGYTHRFEVRRPAGESWTGVAGVEEPEITVLGRR